MVVVHPRSDSCDTVQCQTTDDLPRLAQWEGHSRKYYFVQRATGISQWDIPTKAALSVPTPVVSPAQSLNPYGVPPTPSANTSSDPKNSNAAAEGDRGLFSHAEQSATAQAGDGPTTAEKVRDAIGHFEDRFMSKHDPLENDKERPGLPSSHSSIFNSVNRAFGHHGQQQQVAFPNSCLGELPLTLSSRVSRITVILRSINSSSRDLRRHIQGLLLKRHIQALLP